MLKNREDATTTLEPWTSLQGQWQLQQLHRLIYLLLSVLPLLVLISTSYTTHPDLPSGPLKGFFFLSCPFLPKCSKKGCSLLGWTWYCMPSSSQGFLIDQSLSIHPVHLLCLYKSSAYVIFLTSTSLIQVACSSETSVTHPTSTWCQYSKASSTLTRFHLYRRPRKNSAVHVDPLLSCSCIRVIDYLL